MQRNCRTKKVISILLVLTFLSCLLTGCSNKASSQVNDKLELAVKYLSEQKYEEAILAYKEVIKIDSKNVMAYKGLSLAYVLQEKPDQAEQALQDGLKAVPQNAQLQLAMAGLMVDQGKGDQAEAIYKELIGTSPALSSYQAYTYYLNQQGKSAEAIAMLEQALTNNSNDYQLNVMLAEMYSKSGDKEKALASINRSMTVQIDQSKAYELLVKMYKGKWADLIALGDQYIQQNQLKTGQLIKMTALYNLGRYQDLINQYENLPAEIKESAKARLLASQAYAKLSKPEQAGALINLVKVADLKDAGMLAGIASYYLEAGDKENARKLALLGIEADETVVTNYTVLYKSYVGVDDAMAKIWAYKYLLKSGLGYKSAVLNLTHAGIDLKMQNSTGGSSKAQRMRMIVNTQDYIEKTKSEYKGDTSSYGNWACYLDIEKDIAYVAFMFTPLNQKSGSCFGGWTITSADQLWKNVVFRIHNPRIIPVEEMATDKDVFKESIENYKKYANKYGISQAVDFTSLQMDRFSSPKCRPILISGNNFEKDLTEAGITTDYVLFVDI